MFAYFAHPIDQAGNPPRMRKQIASVRYICANAGIGLFRPGTAYQIETRSQTDHPVTPGDLMVVNAINQAAVWECDALVALLPNGVATLGVPAEIEAALTYGKPVLILTEAMLKERSVQIGDWELRGAKVHTCDADGSFGHLDADTMRRILASPPVPDVVLGILGAEAAKANGQLQVRRHPDAHPLTRAYDTDAGFDLATLHAAQLQLGVRTMLQTGIQAPPPDGWWGAIKTRSSTMLKHGVEVHEGVIDAGYTGELLIAATLTEGDGWIPPGTRLAQYVLTRTFRGGVVEVDALPDSARGSNGFGSSGH